MYSNYHFFALVVLNLFLLSTTPHLVQSQQVKVNPSKEILSPEDKSLTLQCASFGLQPDPYNVVVFTVHDRTIYNSSNLSQKDSDVTVLNKTAIDYFDVKRGVLNARCRINNTSSDTSITIPAVNAVTLSHGTWRDPELGNSTLIRCAYSIQPNVSNMVLSLHLNGTEVGRFTQLPFEPPAFSVPAVVPSLTVVNESSLVYRVTPSDDERKFGRGKFSCVLQVSMGSTSLTIASPEWDTSGASGGVLLASLLPLLTLAAFFSALFTFYY